MGDTKIDRSLALQPVIERLIDELVPLVSVNEVIEHSSSVLSAVPDIEGVLFSVVEGDGFETYRLFGEDGPERIPFGAMDGPIAYRLRNSEAHIADVDNPTPCPPGQDETAWRAPYEAVAKRGVREIFFVPTISGGDVLGALWFTTTIRGLFDEPAFRAQIEVVSAVVSMALGKAMTIHGLDDQVAEITETAGELESANRQLQEFAQMASSGLSDPLRKIITFGQRLEKSAVDDLTERELDYLERIQSASTRMQRLIDDLLVFSSIHMPNAEMHDVNLDDVLDDVLADLELAITESGAEITCAGLPTVFGNPTQLRQLLQNLVGNAIKFRVEGERPRVTVRAIDGDPIRLQVEDEGIGFDPRFLDRIFKPFQRLHAKSEYEGSGIGLSVCRRIVERHGGELTASSTQGEGALFEVTLLPGVAT